MEKEKNFAEGMIFKRSEKAPEFVVVNIGICIGDFLKWATANSDHGWVNVVVKKSKAGKIYAELDTYKPDPTRNDKGFEKSVEAPQAPKEDVIEYPTEEIDPKDIPFN